MDDEDKKGAGWIVSFADLMTLLFAAFVVLYGLIVPGSKDSKVGTVAEIRAAFLDITESINPELDSGPPKKGQYYFTAHYGETSRDTLDGLPKEDVNVAFDRDKNLVENFIDRVAMDDGKKELALRNALTVDEHEMGFTIRLYGAYFFEQGSYRLQEDSLQRFLELGKLLKTIDRPLLIEGHSDANESINQFSKSEIATMRAANAAQVLHDQLNLSLARIETIAYADQRPISMQDRQKNRRIEIKVMYHQR